MIPLNTQPAEKRDYRGDGSLEIVGRPFLTIQGEGPLVGSPAVFVRLAGCSLLCPACDTQYTADRLRRTRAELLDSISEAFGELAAFNHLVIITGGEPFRQNITDLCERLLRMRCVIQIETNGAHAPCPDLPLSHDRGASVTIVCSPKTPNIHPDLEPWIDAYKYVLDADHIDPDDGLPSDVLGTGLRPARPDLRRGVKEFEVFVQPEDTGDVRRNQANEQAAVQSCLKYGYRFSYQLHKALGLE